MNELLIVKFKGNSGQLDKKDWDDGVLIGFTNDRAVVAGAVSGELYLVSLGGLYIADIENLWDRLKEYAAL